MKSNNWIGVVIAVVLGLIVLNALFHVGIGLIGVFFSLLGSLVSLIFSKAGMVLIGVGLIFYILNNRKRAGRDHYYDVY